MNITVVGAGAVGGYFGGRFAEAGLHVTFLVRERRAEQLKHTGLVIQSPYGNLSIEPKLATDVRDIDSCDLVLLAVKNYHMRDTLEVLRPLVEKGARILPMLNGVEHYQMLQDAFGQDAVLGGLTHIISTLNTEGHIVHTNQTHSITFGAFLPSQHDICERLHAAIRKANCSTTFSQTIWSDIWNKYCFITAFSGVTTASRLPIDQILAHDASRLVLQHVLEEMYNLAAAYRAELPTSYVETMVASMKHLPVGSTSSMHQDFRKGLPLEVESLQGAAVRMAGQAGVSVPTVETLYGLIQPYGENPRRYAE